MQRVAAVIFALAMGAVAGCAAELPPLNDSARLARVSPDWGACVRSLAAGPPEIKLTVCRVEGDSARVLVSNAIPFPREVLFDARNIVIRKDGREIPIAAREIVKWPDSNSIRSVLIQFNYELGPAKRDTVVLSFGAPRTTPDLELTPVTWTLPGAIAVSGKEWMSYSGALGSMVPAGYSVATPAGIVDNTAYDANFLAHYRGYESFGGGERGVVEETNYYDNMHSLYQQFLRTGNVEYYKLARRWAVYHRTRQIAPLESRWPGRRTLDGTTITRYTYVEGLVDDYLLNGDEGSLRVAGVVVDQFYMKLEELAGWGVYYKAPRKRGFWTEREPAFALLGIVCYYEATLKPAYRQEAGRIVHSLHRMQVENQAIDGQTGFIHNLYDHDPQEGAKVDSWGGSTWMTGLLLEGIIRYHIISQDPAAAESVTMAVDWLTRFGRVGTGDSWVYFTAPSRAGRPYYDLNQMITHAYAYAYRLSGYNNAEYFTLGLGGYNAGIAKAHLGDQKHLNQNYRSSPNFLGYLANMDPRR